MCWPKNHSPPPRQPAGAIVRYVGSATGTAPPEQPAGIGSRGFLMNSKGECAVPCLTSVLPQGIQAGHIQRCSHVEERKISFSMYFMR